MKYLLLIFALTMCFSPEVAPQGNHVNNPIKNPIIKLMQQNNHSKVPFKLPNRQLGLIYQPSVVTYDDTIKVTYTYDNEGNCTSKLTQSWSTNSIWVNTKLNIFTYNSAGQILTEIDQTWNINAWNNSNRLTYIYSDSGKLFTNIQEQWIVNAWVFLDRKLNTYDNSGNLIITLFQYWLNNSWTNSAQYISTYSSSGKILTELDQTWVNNAWFNLGNTSDTYDPAGNLITNIQQNWSGTEWDNSEKSDYYFDPAGKIYLQEDHIWMDSSWTQLNLFTYTYDNSDNLIQYVYENWGNQAWQFNYQEFYTYDVSNNCISKLSQLSESAGWTNYEKTLYSFDNNGNCVQGENLIWNGVWAYNANDIVLYYNHHQSKIEYNNTAIATVSYVQVTGVADENISVNQFSLKQNYPNPFNPTTTINFSLAKQGNVKLSVYDITGSKVATIVNENKPAGNYSVKFNAFGIASGIYLYRLESGNYIAARKFILMK